MRTKRDTPAVQRATAHRIARSSALSRLLRRVLASLLALALLAPAHGTAGPLARACAEQRAALPTAAADPADGEGHGGAAPAGGTLACAPSNCAAPCTAESPSARMAEAAMGIGPQAVGTVPPWAGRAVAPEPRPPRRPA